MNGLAAYLALFAPLSLALALAGRGAVRAVWLGGAGLQLVALVLTSTRATPLALGVGVGVAAAVALRGKIRTAPLPRWAVGAGLAVAVAAAGIAAPVLLPRVVGVGTNRPALAYAAVSLGAEAPWLGHGDIQYNTYLASRADAMQTPYGVASTTPHNSPALAWFRYGVLGVLLTAWILVGPPVWLARRARSAAGERRTLALAGLVAFTAFAVQSLSNNLLEVPQVAVHYWSLWALLTAGVEGEPFA